MPRRRKSNKHLPERMYINHNTYFYVDRAGKWHNLGREFIPALQKWGELISETHCSDKKINTMNQLFNKYLEQVAPFKGQETYKGNLKEIINLRLVFGKMRPQDIKPSDVHQFLLERGKRAKTRANRERALLSHTLTKAVEWGIIAVNPCFGVKRITEQSRDRYISDAEFSMVRSIANPQWKNIMDLAYVTGLRQSDLRLIKVSNITESGLKIYVSKVKKWLLINKTEKLNEILEKTKLTRPDQNSDYLFCTQSGSAYTANGFRAAWQRLIDKALGYCAFMTMHDPLDQYQLNAIIKGNKIFILKRNGNYIIAYADLDKRHKELTITDKSQIKLLDTVEFDKKAQSIRWDELNLYIYKLLKKNHGWMKPFEFKVIEERFNFHDIRRKTATDVTEAKGIEAGRKLLLHQDQKMTAVYVSGVQKAEPLEKDIWQT